MLFIMIGVGVTGIILLVLWPIAQWLRPGRAYDLDTAINEIVTIVLEKALSSAIELGEFERVVNGEQSDDESSAPLSERQHRLDRLKSWEMLRGRRKGA